VDPLVEALKDKELQVRLCAVGALTSLGTWATSAVRGLIEALNDPDLEVRRSAINGLGELGPAAKAAVPALIELETSDPKTSGDSRKALTRIKD